MPVSSADPKDAEQSDVLQSLCNSPISTVVTDPRARDNPIVAVNKAFERLSGYAACEVIGRNCRFLAGDQAAQTGSEVLREAIHTERPALTELINYKRDGTPFRNAVMVAPLFDNDGKLRFFVGSQMEIPDGAGVSIDRKQASKQLVAGLTTRQREVLREMTLGFRNKQIAEHLGLSEKTVKMHRGSLLGRLHAVSSTHAVRIAMEAGL